VLGSGIFAVAVDERQDEEGYKVDSGAMRGGPGIDSTVNWWEKIADIYDENVKVTNDGPIHPAIEVVKEKIREYDASKKIVEIREDVAILKAEPAVNAALKTATNLSDEEIAALRFRLAQKIGQNEALPDGKVVYVNNKPIWVVQYKNSDGNQKTAVFNLTSETLIANVVNPIEGNVEWTLEGKVLMPYKTPDIAGSWPITNYNGIDIGTVLKNTAEIDMISSSMRQLEAYIGVRGEDAVEFTGIAIVVKDNLTESAASSVIGAAADKEYQVMTQQLTKMFSDGGVTKVTKDNFASKVSDLIARGKKVVLLDDGELMEDADISSIQGAKPGSNFCAVSMNKTELSKQLSGVDVSSVNMPFINLNAMALIGVGVLDNDRGLFQYAYSAFTGNQPPQNLLKDFEQGMLFMVPALPRMLKVNNDFDGINKMKRAFAVSV
jgi:hypothetical protein